MPQTQNLLGKEGDANIRSFEKLFKTQTLHRRVDQ
jgi:hypothetical protein